MVVAKARVLRDGKEMEVNGEEVVPGDIVLLASGGRVPADIRLIRGIEFKAAESMLTGESIPAEKTSEPIPNESLTPGDQLNMAFMGTVVVNGRARGIVVATGDRTILGHIARDVQEIRLTRSPLQEKIDRFAQAIGVIVLGAATLLFLVGIPGGREGHGHVHDRGSRDGSHHPRGFAHRGDHRSGHRSSAHGPAQRRRP